MVFSLDSIRRWNVLLPLVLACVVSCLIPASADASILSLTPTTGIFAEKGDPNGNRWENYRGPGNMGNPSIAEWVGFQGELTTLFKYERDTQQVSGLFADDYKVNIFGSNKNFDLSWIGSQFINYEKVYIYIKDGNHPPPHFIFDISNGGFGLGWSGTGTIEGRNFWPTSGGAISHITILGAGQLPEFVIPEPGAASIWLLGLCGWLGLGAVRRRRSQS